MVAVRRVADDELSLARALHNRFTAQDRSIEEIQSWYDDVPELFLFAVDGDDVVGATTGRPGEEQEAEGVSLAGIGVEPERRAEGIGSQLLDHFEANARDIGAERIGVASAGGYVDRFYLDAGFEPEEILVLDPEGEPGNYEDTPHEVRWKRRDDGAWKCYVDVDGHDEAFLETVREEFGDEEAIYLMAKPLTTE